MGRQNGCAPGVVAPRGLVAEQCQETGPPKEALERVLRESRLPRSSAIYGRLARRVSLRRCEEESFQRFCERLRFWFPKAPEP